MAQLDNIPAMLKSGEYVVRKEAVDEIGKENMDMINNIDRLGYMGGGLVPQGEHGHSAIDELLALNTLVNQRSVDMDRQTSMMNKGGMAKKKKNAYRDGGLGVQDKLAMAMDEFKDIEKVLSYANPSEYSFPKSQRDMLDYLQESGQTDVNEALKALDLIQKRYQEGSVGFHMPRYQEGGLMNYQDGGYSPSDSINQYYETFGYEPTDEKTKKQFEKLYAYDPTEALGDVSQLRTDISQELGTATADTSSYGVGFKGFGGRQKAMEDVRTSAQRAYETDSMGIMEASKADSEADALQFLAGLQQSDAGMRQFTIDPQDNPATNVSVLPTSDQGTVFYNGSTWIWSEEEGQYVQS